MTETATYHVCRACGGDGWLESLPEGQSECPYCQGTGKCQDVDRPKIKDLPPTSFIRRWLDKLGDR